MVVKVADTVADELTKYILERQDNQREDRLAASLLRQQELEGGIREARGGVVARSRRQRQVSAARAARNQYVVVLQQYDSLASDQGCCS